MNLDLALYYASIGCYVFPCISSGPRRKAPCGGLGWRNVSTTDEVDIRRLWARFPDAVPGIDMGKSGLITVDCDCKQSDGLAWVGTQTPLDGVPGSITPSGGRHLIYRNTINATNSRGRLPGKDVADIDIRGEGGYIIAPGAIFSDGGTYEPIGDVSTATDLPPVLIAYLERQRAPPIEADDFEALAPFSRPTPISDLRKDRYGQTAMAELERDLASVPPGDRNNQANLIGFRVGQLVGGGCIDLGEAYSRLEAAVLSWGVSPRDKSLGRRGTIWRAIEAGRGSPRGPTDDRMPISMRINFDDVELEDEPPPASLRDFPGYNVDWTRPGGLLGEMTEYILLTSYLPNRPLAVASAIATLSAICGRHLYAPTGAALNVYLVLMGKTSIGKDRPLHAASNLLTAAGHPSLSQTGKAFSISALEQLIEEHPACVAAIDEIGTSMLAPICSPRSNHHHQGMKAVLQELWSRSLGKEPFHSTRRAKVRGVTASAIVATPAPSLTLLGASTPERFWESVSGGSISDGFLNRFLLVDAAPRGKPQNVPQTAFAVPPSIVRQLRAIVPKLLGGNLAGLLGVFDPRVTPGELEALSYQMEWSDPSVEASADRLGEALIEVIDSRPPELRDLMGRVFEYGIRLASLHAVSCRGAFASVDHDDLSWGMSLSMDAGQLMVDGMQEHMHASETQEIAKAILRVIKRAGGKIASGKLKRALAFKYKKADLDSMLVAMIEAGVLAVENVETGRPGRPATWYLMLKQ